MEGNNKEIFIFKSKQKRLTKEIKQFSARFSSSIAKQLIAFIHFSFIHFSFIFHSFLIHSFIRRLLRNPTHKRTKIRQKIHL